ncbi:MAG TPA: hypothetical protein VE130_13385 [Nitrososphaeraceae archaeon]|nr:hypothetical protein [Nitrososphaeraceae archaeon]
MTMSMIDHNNNTEPHQPKLIREYDEENQTIDCIITIDAIRTQILNSQSVHLEWDDGGERYGDIPGTSEC